MERKPYKTINEYIASCPKNIRVILEKIRFIIRESAPGAEETISYGMPAFRLKGHLVYFAAYKNHIGFYPTPSPIVAFKKELSQHKFSKGAIQFPINKPIPYDLIRKIVDFRVKELL